MKAKIAHQGGLIDLSWDGFLKATPVKSDYRKIHQIEFAKHLQNPDTSIDNQSDLNDEKEHLSKETIDNISNEIIDNSENDSHKHFENDNNSSPEIERNETVSIRDDDTNVRQRNFAEAPN